MVVIIHAVLIAALATVVCKYDLHYLAMCHLIIHKHEC